MKKKIFALILTICMAASLALPAEAVSLKVSDSPSGVPITLINSVSYVPLRACAMLLGANVSVSWENQQAVVRNANLTLTAKPGAYYINANGRMLFAKDGVRLVGGTTLVPVRVLAKAMDAAVSWSAASGQVGLTRGSGTIASGSSFYNADDLYWLSRIISAESAGEPLFGKIAVGNVVMNRVASAGFPDSIHDVIFDRVGGIQFTPVANGTINNTPTEESVLAAKLCLDGADVVGNSLFFLNPGKSSSTWITKNCSYVTTIGSHSFYA